ncbi:MAG: DnaJ domain-containing protein [Bacteroidales bacterium]|jgi:DnaJ like chaperone protein|nr:DnaJ domain-containing protein [Bacteroidales bacterium]
MCSFVFIGGFLGVLAAGYEGGVAGVIIGYLVGFIVDRSKKIKFNKSHYDKDDYIQVLLILSSAVIKSSKERMVKSELYFVRDYLVRNLSPQDAQDALYLFKEIMNQEFDVDDICNQVKVRASQGEKLFILQFLMGISGADGDFHDQELQLIRRITLGIGLRLSDYEAVRVMFMGNFWQQQYQNQYQNRYQYQNQSNTRGSVYSGYSLEDDYKVLEISSAVSNEELKKAFRKAAMKHHPDRVAHLGEDIRKAAEEKFSRVNQAYERIKQARGIN